MYILVLGLLLTPIWNKCIAHPEENMVYIGHKNDEIDYRSLPTLKPIPSFNFSDFL